MNVLYFFIYKTFGYCLRRTINTESEIYDSLLSIIVKYYECHSHTFSDVKRISSHQIEWEEKLLLWSDGESVFNK